MKKLRLLLAGAIVFGTLAACEKEEVTTNEDNSSNTPTTKNQSGDGYGGSLAQFTIVGDYLYTIDYKTLNVFHLADPGSPVLSESIDMGIGMETVFHRNGNLFIGSTDGVHIYDISDPRNPMPVSEFEHVTSCDPVVANDNYACATMRGGTECGGSLSQLTILDISSIDMPMEVASAELINPYGLGFSNADQNILYICDGYSGLKAYDISDASNPQLVMEDPNLEALDIIAQEDNNLIVLTRQGVYQFDASNPLALTERSFIPVQ